MSHKLDQRNIELLKNDANQLILESQGLIEASINYFFKSIRIIEEREEIRQLINEELLFKIPQIKQQYKGKALFKTYLISVIRNICLKIITKREKVKYVCYTDLNICEPEKDILNNLFFQEEITRFYKILELYHKHKKKLILCLTLKFRIPFDIQIFITTFGTIKQEEYNTFVQQIQPYHDCHDVSIFAALTPIINSYENKNNTPDALRKWIKLKINELIDFLNASPSSSNYTEETLQILFEKCFCNEKDVMTKVF